jgi:hypothetical protein
LQRQLIPAIGSIAASLFPLSADCLPTQLFAAGAPLNWISHIIFLYLLETDFYNLKSKFPFTLKEKYQQFNANERSLD